MSLLSSLLFGPIRVGGQQEQDVLVEASPLGFGFGLQCFALLVGIETEDYCFCHGREGSTKIIHGSMLAVS